ncbi:MAG: hypothetical protein Fur0021_35820 [Candidatus Promineifilaceae bacterium]
MSESSATLNHPPRRFWRNPVAIKELRGRMRGRRAFVVLTVYLALMAGFITLVYAAYLAGSSPSNPDARLAGKTIFSALVIAQLFLVVFIAPAFTAGTITGEREKQTYDILRTTLLSEGAFIGGKLQSALAYVLLLLAAAIPLESIAFLMGGVSLSELIISQVMLVQGSLTFALLGLFFSSLMRTTLAATVATFAATFFVTIGFPILIFLLISILGPLIAAASSFTPIWPLPALAIYVGLALVATNLPASMILSEIILIEEGTVWAFTATIDGHPLLVLSPWYLHLFCSILFAWLLYTLTIRRLRRPSAT